MTGTEKKMFIDVVGNIDDCMIQEAARPWVKKRTISLHQWSRYAAAVFAAVILGAGCLFHTEVKANFDKATSWIGRMLGISEDLTSYMDVKDMSVTHHGLTFTLQEVILDQKILFFEVNSQFEEAEKREDIDLTFSLFINGKEQLTQGKILTNASPDMLATRYVESYYIGGALSDNSSAQIDIILSVKSADGKTDYGKYRFPFEASAQSLEADTKHVDVAQTIYMEDKTALRVDQLSINALDSTVHASCDALDSNAEYEIHGTDDQGNQIVYELLSYENREAIFVKTAGGIASDARTLELQLYKQAYTGTQISYEEHDGIAAVDESVEPAGDLKKEGDRICVSILR